MVVKLIGRFGYKKIKWVVGEGIQIIYIIFIGLVSVREDGLRFVRRGQGLPCRDRLPSV
jgi:hypothetical protein